MSAMKDLMLEQEEAKTLAESALPQVEEPVSDTVTPTKIPMDSIVLQFQNTRRKLIQADIDSLKASILAIDLISAVTVKPLEDGQYLLLAGFKRYEAMKQLGRKEINAIVLSENIDEAHATEVNLAENFNRSGLSLGEQCTAVKRLFTVLEGSEEDKVGLIAVRLNLTAKQVKDRLILTSLSEDGLCAFDDGKIPLKSAIVLAGVSDEQQQEFLTKMLAGNMDHNQLLEVVGKATLPLSLAKFDTTDCQQCPSNSQIQGSLFSDATDLCGTGDCKNVFCFKDKSKAWYDNRLKEMESEFGTIIPVSQVDKTAISMITVDQLGEAQIKQCQTCTNNVSLIQNKIGDSFGNLMNNVCNKKSCFTDCVNTYRESLAPPANVDSSHEIDTPAIDAAPTTPVTDGNKTKPVSSKGKSAETASYTASLSKAGKESARKAVAKIQIDKGLDDPRDTTMLMMLAVMRLTGDFSSYQVKDIQQALTMEPADLEAKMNDALTKRLANAMKESGETNDNFPVGNILLTLLTAKGQLDEAIIQSWTVAELKHMTKAGIKQILTESGFQAYCDDKEKGSFSKLMAQKVPDIHTALAATDFDFSHYAPKAYIDEVKKVAASIK